MGITHSPWAWVVLLAVLVVVAIVVAVGSLVIVKLVSKPRPPIQPPPWYSQQEWPPSNGPHGG